MSSEASRSLHTANTSGVSRRQRLWLAAIGLFAGVMVLAVAAWYSPTWIFSLRSANSDAEPGQAESPDSSPAADSIVRLSPEKLAVAGLHSAEVTVRDVQSTEMVPGQLAYDAARHLELKTPVDCVVRQVLVEPGQTVRRGDVLAVLTSTEVGLARDEVEQKEAELNLARHEDRWASDTGQNLTELLILLAKRPTMVEVEKAFAGKPLGDHREKVVSAYSRLLLAESVAATTQGLGESGVVTGRILQERQSNREVALAAFQAACETSEFQSRHAQDRAQAEVEHAQRMLAISQRRLQTLLGPLAADPKSDGDALSELRLSSPLDGRVQERLVVESAHVLAGQTMFVLADTGRLWVKAQIHERQWEALSLAGKRSLVVKFPALPGEEFSAKVRFAEAAVSSQTRTLPLVAEMENSDGRLRPGMFAWVEVPVSAAISAVAVPVAAVMRHEDQPFVFVELRPGKYRRVDVSLGRQTPEWVEIASGLSAGERVVDQGAFVLKSELLLEREAD